MNSLINALLMVGFAILLSFVGPALDDNSKEHSTAKEAIEQQKKAQRFEKAAQAVCGTNAAFTDLGDGVIQCLTKKGRKTMKVTM